MGGVQVHEIIKKKYNFFIVQRLILKKIFLVKNVDLEKLIRNHFLVSD